MKFKSTMKCISAVLAALMVTAGTSSLYAPVQAADTSAAAAKVYADAVTGGNKVGVTDEVVKIMPVGDSITFGMGETGGYRKYLYNNLQQMGYKIDMVGPEGQNSANFNGMSYDDNNAGYSGYTIKQQYPIPSWGENGLLEKLKNKNAVKQAQPDIILLIIGTNDMTANRAMDACEQDLHSLLDYMIADMPSDCMIFMGSIPEFTAYGGNAQRVANYNNTVKKVAEDYANSGKNVRFADVHGCLNGTADLGNDQLHPNGTGYQKMGKFWADTVDEYLIASQPVETTTTTTTTTATTTTTTTIATTTTAPVTQDPKAVLDSKVTKWGDANNDKGVDMSDVVLIMQSLANPNKYQLTEPGLYNADVSEAGGGITSNDALVIQKFLLGLITKLPESYSENIKIDGGEVTTTTNVATTTTTAPAAETTTTTAPPAAGGALNDDFDSGVGDWTGRGAASVAASDTAYYGASGKSLFISDRSAEWNGAAINLGSDFQPGQTYSVSLGALQLSGSDATIQVSLQQGGGNGSSATYTSIVKETCKSGEWTKIENTSFTIPDNAGDMILYVETVEASGDLMDFYIDNVQVAAEGTKSTVTTGGEGKVPEIVIPEKSDYDSTKWDNYNETASAQYIDFYKSSIKHMGNTYRLTQKLAAAESGQSLTVAYLGGSITEGKNYTTPFSNYLKTTFAKGSFKEINAGLSGTSSVVGLVRSEKQIVEQNPDIIFLEFSVNDHEDIMYKKCFESCIKKFLDMPNEPAVGIIITRAKGGFSSQAQMYPIGKNFDIPVISMDDALTKAFNSGFLQTSDYYTDEYHPHQKGGQLVADCMAYYVRQALKSENQSAGYTQPTKYVYGTEYANCVNVDPKNLTNFNAGSWKSGGGYNNNPGLNYSYTLNGGSPMTFKTQGKGLIIVFKANSSGMGSINVTVNGKTTKVNGNKQYTWGGPDAELGYYQETSGDLDVSITGSGSFTIWGIGLIK